MSDTLGTYDIKKSVEAQLAYCERTSTPHFAPNDGICWRCGRNIYAPLAHNTGQEFITGVTVEQAGHELVTGCPHCNRSYCD